ncbi:MAG: hypothetical protein VX730_05830 [Pseudomonadota bacterium]|nr:hypothetical protein [Pseudomonadota bacterium]
MFIASLSHYVTGKGCAHHLKVDSVQECMDLLFQESLRHPDHVVTGIWQNGRKIPLPITVDDQQRVLHGIPGAAEKAKVDLERFCEKCAA